MTFLKYFTQPTAIFRFTISLSSVSVDLFGYIPLWLPSMSFSNDIHNANSNLAWNLSGSKCFKTLTNFSKNQQKLKKRRQTEDLEESQIFQLFLCLPHPRRRLLKEHPAHLPSPKVEVWQAVCCSSWLATGSGTAGAVTSFESTFCLLCWSKSWSTMVDFVQAILDSILSSFNTSSHPDILCSCHPVTLSWFNAGPCVGDFWGDQPREKPCIVAKQKRLRVWQFI